MYLFPSLDSNINLHKLIVRLLMNSINTNINENSEFYVHGEDSPTKRLQKKAIEAQGKTNRSILDQTIGSVLYGCEMSLIAVIIPGVVTNLAWVKLIWPAIAVMVLWILFKLIKNSSRQQTRADWASEALDVCKLYEDLEPVCVSLQGKQSSLKKRLLSIDNAICVLSKSLRRQVMQKHSANVDCSGGLIRCTTTMTPDDIYGDIHSLCNYISEVAGIISDTPIRCGVVIKDPGKSEYVPIVVYDPNNTTYKSKSIFKTGSGFSEHIIEEYNKSVNLPNHKKHAYMVIPDIKKHNENEKIPKIHIQKNQEEHMRSMAGVVIYFRVNSNETRVLGAINIDCSEAGIITSERFLEMCAYLRLAYRLLADKLLLINDNPEIFNAIKNLK